MPKHLPELAACMPGNARADCGLLTVDSQTPPASYLCHAASCCRSGRGGAAGARCGEGGVAPFLKTGLLIDFTSLLICVCKYFDAIENFKLG